MTPVGQPADLVFHTNPQSAGLFWVKQSVRTRLQVVRRFRELLAARCDEFAAALNKKPVDALAADVMPLAAACRFLERRAESILRPRRLPNSDRPSWLHGVDVEIHREPFGRILIIGPFNYPLFLPGVQALQALTAGNAVIVKPGRGGLPVMELMAVCLHEAGLDMRLFQVLSEAPEEVQRALEQGVDKVLLTGSNATGRQIMPMLAASGTPAVMELSGHDPVFVQHGADLDLVVKAIRFGLQFNNGDTCIAPKVVYTSGRMLPELQARLQQAGLTIPVVEAGDRDAPDDAAASGYALGASVFGPEKSAMQLAARINAGVVTVNDIVAPTADPRVPFGGRGLSGFGITRGAEGLLELTAVKAVIVRRSRWMPHFMPRHPLDARLISSFIKLTYAGSLKERVRALKSMVHNAMRRR